MPITAAPLPPDSLLARLREAECYRDAFRVEVPRRVHLAAFLRAFYGSAAFMPERLALGLIRRGGTRADIAALAEGRTDRFAAWTVEAREPASNSEAVGGQILLRDFQDRTCSWLMAKPTGEHATILWFSSAVRHPDRALVTALMPLHRWYSRRLLAGAMG